MVKKYKYKKYRGAGFVFITNNKNILLLKKINNKWSLPGGRRDEGEYPLDTAIRETYEEVGMMPLGQIIMYLLTPAIDKTLCYTFIKRIDKQFLPTLSTEHIDYIWVDLKNIFDYKLTKTTKNVLLKLIKRKI